MEKDAEKYCKACYGCQLVSRPSLPEPIRAKALPKGPWRDLAVDLLGPLPTGESIRLVVDYYSHYYEVDILRSTVTSKIISSLEEMFARCCLPESLSSDNGPQFIAAKFAEYMEQQGIRRQRVRVKCSHANGEVEHQNSSLLKQLQIAHAKKKNWKRELTMYLAAYRSLSHPTTGVSPAKLLFGRRMCGLERQNSSLLKRLQIAHAEKKNWKRKLTTYLAAYRSLSYPMTEVSPAKSLFGRRMCTKLPKLSDAHVEQEVRD